jgi:hypothetical protein
MNSVELLKAFLQVPELSTVGSALERAAFIAVRVEGRTVREVAEAIGISKSQVTNLADLFQAKLATKVMQSRTGSEEYRLLYRRLQERLWKVQEADGTEDYDDPGEFKLSREDYAEVTGTPLKDPDEWN